MSKVLIVSQPFGLGDIIFTQTIVNDYMKDGYRILWPVKPQFVEGLNRAYPWITFVDHTILPINLDERQKWEKNGFTYLPMRYAEFLMKLPYKFHMKSKYDFIGKDWARWKENAMPVRYHEKEKGLSKHLGIKKGDKYNLISTVFGSDANHKIDVDVKNKFRNIEMSQVTGYSLFDWCEIIENATTIHAVSSSSLYLFEILNLQAKEVHLYCRVPIERNFEFVEFLFTKNYILHT